MTDPAALFDAVRAGDVDGVRSLLGTNRSLAQTASEYAKTALHWAAELDRVEIAAELVAAGADVEARTSWGATPFDWAATMGSGRVADFLLAKGASGLSLVTAAALGKLAEVRAFVEAGGNLAAHRRRGAPDGPDGDWPPDSAHVMGDVLSDALHAAARNGHTAVVTYLLERGANVDAVGFFGATGMHWAAINGHRDTVALLLERNADPARRDARFDATPEGWAREGGHEAIAAMLQRARDAT